jgi:hypothetical protein
VRELLGMISMARSRPLTLFEMGLAIAQVPDALQIVWSLCRRSEAAAAWVL